jgi:hypothetical protein
MLLFACSFVLYVMLVIRPELATENIHTDYTIASFALAFIPFAIGMLWMELLPQLIKTWFNQWKVYKEFFFIGSCILVIGILNCVYFFFFANLDFGMSWIITWKIILITLSSGLIPLSLITLWNFVKLERMRQKSVPVVFTETIESQESHVESIVFQDDEGMFKLAFRETYAIESMGNYVKIHQVQDQADCVCLKRVTMKRMEELLQHQQTLVRVHRGYIVNLSHVARMHKDDTGDLYLLFSYDNSIRVPVSRNKRKQVSDLLENRNTA